MGQPSEAEKTWLVKSSGAILGPFALEEVIQLLTNKRISLIDEIRSPESRWLFIREHRQFANIVQFLREQQSESREDTGSTFVGTRTVTMSPEETTSVPIQNPAPSSASNAGGVAIPEPKPITYAAQTDFRVQRKLESERKWYSTVAWIVLLLVLVGGGGYWYLNQKASPKTSSYSEYIQMAQMQTSIGHYDQALVLYRKAESLQKLSPRHKLMMVPLLMVVEKQNAQARQILDEVRAELPPTPAQEVDILNLRAFSFLNEGQLAEAKRRFQEVVRNVPPPDSALVNLLEIAILEEQFAEAMEGIRRIMAAGIKEPLVYLYRSLAHYRQFTENEKLDAVIVDLQRYVGRYSDGQVEAYLLMAATNKKMNREAEVNQVVKTMLQVDPDLSRKHVHDLLIHEEVIQWGYLGRICEMLVRTSADSPQMKALAGFCSYQAGDLKNAIDLVEKARLQYAGEVSLMGLHAFLLYRSGRQAEAKALIQATSGAGNELLVSTSAWICQDQKDWSCAERDWKRIQGINSQSLASFAGLARVAIAQGHNDRAKDFVQQGLLISDHYRPLLEIKEQLDAR
jgi:tetratricopeptide (TPR) repeat protein